MASRSAAEVRSPDEIRQLRAQLADFQFGGVLLDAILKQSPILVSVVRAPDFVYELANPALERLAPGKQFIGRRFSEVWEDIPDPLTAILQNVAQTGLEFQMEDAPFRIRRSAGGPVETVYLTYRWIPLPGPDGKTDRVLTIAHETTARVLQRKTEQKLRAQARLTSDIVGNSPAGIALLSGKDLRFQFANAAYRAFIPGRLIQGRTFEEVWPELHSQLKDVFTEVLDRGVTYEATDLSTFLRRDPNGPLESRHFSWFVTRVPMPGQEDWGLLNTCIETTQLRRAEETLRETDARFRVAAQAGKFGAYDADLVATTLYWSPEMRDIIGFSVDAPPPLPDAIAHFVHPDEQADLREVMSRAYAGDGIVRHEFRVVRPDGSIRWLHVRGLVQFVSEGANRRPVRDTGVVIDITERKLAEEERAHQARMKDEFLALLGHELRNPRAAISTATQLLIDGVPEERRISLKELIGRQVDVLERLVDDLLDLARITQGTIEIKKETVDLSVVLTRAAEVVQPAIDKRRQEMILRTPPEPVLFMADSVRLEQVITNLLTNASRYSANGGRIELSGSREAGEIVIRCKDNGQGIPANMRERIFEPFTRVSAAPQESDHGVGIGLAIVRRLVELHDGSVSVESRGLGKGSEFTVRLPLIEPPESPRMIPPRASLASGQRSLSVVLIQDGSAVAQPMVTALKKAGHRVRLFSDGPSALRGLARLRPGAILVDLQPPRIEGRELATRLKAKSNLRDTIFVAVSDNKSAASNGGTPDPFDHYFVRSTDFSQLLALLETKAGQKNRITARSDGSAKGAVVARVLLVEDHPELAEVTADILRQHGLEVQVAGTGRKALDLAAEFRPELVLCDLHLPDTSGENVVTALRSMPGTRQAYAVFLTATREAELRSYQRRAKKLGVDELIAKPLLPDTLRSLIAKARVQRRK